MKNDVRWLRVLGVTLLAGLLFIGCQDAIGPGGDGERQAPGMLALSGYGEDSLSFYSGEGACGEYDPNIFVVTPSKDEPVPHEALIGGGGPAPECSCTVIGDLLPPALPVTTLSESDVRGVFTTSFALPDDFYDAMMKLWVIADDGARIILNNHILAEVDLNDGVPEEDIVVREVIVAEDSYFVEGDNVLIFEVVNTGTGSIGPPVARADTADCMYVAFRAMVGYIVPPDVTIDVKPGSDENPINCRNENGVIPVAILTTDGFDAMDVDHTTIHFGPSGAMETHFNKHGMKRHEEDVDYDGDVDLMFHFRGYETGIACTDTMVTLWGETYDGVSFEVSDHIRIVGRK